MNEWTFYQFLFQSFDTQFLAAVQTGATNLLSAVQGPLLLFVTVYIAWEASKELFAPSANPLMDFVRVCIRAVIVITMLTAASYTQLFQTFMLTTLPNELTAAVSNSGVNVTGTPAAFDKLFQGGFVALDQILKNVSVFSVKSLVLGLFTAMEFLVGALFIAIGFLIYIASHIMLGLAITVGPLFVCALLFRWSVFLFSAWICTLLAMVLTQVLIVALLSLLLVTEQNILTQIVNLNAAGGANGNNLGAQIHYLVEAALLYFMIGYLSPKIEELARALTHGASPAISSLSQMAHGKLATGATAAGRAAVSGVKSAGSSLAGAAGMRSIKPVGKAP